MSGKVILPHNHHTGEPGQLKEAIPSADTIATVAEALKQLGYKPTEIRPVMKKLANEKGSTDELMKKALAMLVK